MKLTATEYLVASDMLNGTGGQQLTIAANGAALQGTVYLTESTIKYVSLYVPAGVTFVVEGSTVKNPLQVIGSVKDYGDISFADAKGNTVQDLITRDLYVASTGAITDPGALDITTKTIDNAGTITSGTLSVRASSEFTNAGTVTGTNGLNLDSGTGIFTNSGMLASTIGNVLLNSANPIVLNNTGTVQALQGAINIREASYKGSRWHYIEWRELFIARFEFN